MTLNLDVGAAQRALDALIAGDLRSAADQFSPDVVLSGAGGCLIGHAAGLPSVLERFAAMVRCTNGTFGTEVAAVFGRMPSVVVITRHWASVDGDQIHATQALLVTAACDRIATITALSSPGPPSGIWD